MKEYNTQNISKDRFFSIGLLKNIEWVPFLLRKDSVAPNILVIFCFIFLCTVQPGF